MARVKNQVLFEDEESYTDAAGLVYFNGVSYRQSATEAYPGYIGAEYGTVRKSPRSRRPSHQGRGSSAQGPYRDCFAACAERWNNLPDICGDDQTCDPTSSKERVLDAKADAGVSCSAFDLYMRCCMQNCGIIQVSGPGGVSYSGGVIPEAESCFKCPDNLPDFSIAAASPVVPCGASIALSIDPEPAEGISWSIAQVSGGGGLVGDIYTAPASNPNCASNPTFDLTVCDRVVGSFSLAVNCAGTGARAYLENPGCAVYKDLLAWGCACTIGWGETPCRYQEYDCNGDWLRISGYHVYSDPVRPGYCYELRDTGCDSSQFPAIIDLRSDALKLAGCCPPVF